jgi:hypothetical protein
MKPVLVDREVLIWSELDVDYLVIVFRVNRPCRGPKNTNIDPVKRET